MGTGGRRKLCRIPCNRCWGILKLSFGERASCKERVPFLWAEES